VGHFGETFREHVINVMQHDARVPQSQTPFRLPPLAVATSYTRPSSSNPLLVVPRVAHTDAYVFSLRVLSAYTWNPSWTGH
jgi:hypothetical protein